jgi:two-component system response regulator PilR (NtrC family)
MNREAGRILVVDDEQSMLEMMEIVLQKEDCNVATTLDPLKALDMVREQDFDAVVQDLKMPRMNGLKLLEKIKTLRPELPVIIITAFSTWDNAVEAMRLGAFDYIKKPFDTDNIRAVVRRAVEQKRSLEESSAVSLMDVGEIVGSSAPMQKVLATVRRVAATDSTVVIQGESGTGKELIARALHYNSMRSKEPFITVNCGAFTETLLESELFGHVRGAFTGAVSDKKGLFEIADRGTLFLDEVSEMSPATQVKVLRVLEDRQFMPVGGMAARRVDVRFITATNRILEEEVASNRFREDLYYRLNVIPIEIPPLRDRKEDIPLLAGHFLAIYSKSMGKQVTAVSEKARAKLLKHDWPGNVRELENVIQRSVAFCEGDHIEDFDLFTTRQPAASAEPVSLPEGGINLEERLADIERSYILQALETTRGNITQAAELLGVSFRSLRYKMKKLGIEA